MQYAYHVPFVVNEVHRDQAKKMAGRNVKGSPPPARSASPKADLLDSRLDALWVQYLDLLDQYTKAQEELSKLMSSGFFSLAQANRSPMHGRRYGQDWYDQRMKTSRRCQIVEQIEHTSTGTPISSYGQVFIADWVPVAQDADDKDGAESKSAKHQARENVEPKQQPSPPRTPDPVASSTSEKAKDAQESKAVSHMDPIRWYGILVPPELRRAQAFFTTSISGPHGDRTTAEKPDQDDKTFKQGPLVKAANAARAMKAVDAEIRRVRKIVRKADRAALEGKHQEPRS